MMIKDVKTYRPFVTAFCLLLLFVSYQGSIMLFTHVHYVNGVLITHSHPFQEQHTHSNTELLVIDRCAFHQMPEVEYLELPAPVRPLLGELLTKPRRADFQAGDMMLMAWRAPPVFRF